MFRVWYIEVEIFAVLGQWSLMGGGPLRNVVVYEMFRV